MIQILVTGGTIDKIYNPLNGKFEFGQTNIDEILTTARVKENYQLQTLFLKDSLKIKNNDREKISKFCQNCQYDKIIISHGTDTIVETAKNLTSISNKTIILFGSMVPFSVKKSDSIFNLSAAFNSVQILQNGVYITMNGKIFTANNVVKNTKIGEFKNL